MSLKKDNLDVSDEELDKIINPFYEKYNDFVITYVMPEAMAFYIVSSYHRNAMCEATLRQHYNSAKDLINMFGENEEKIKTEFFKLLRVKYVLSITNENPLEIKKIDLIEEITDEDDDALYEYVVKVDVFSKLFLDSVWC